MIDFEAKLDETYKKVIFAFLKDQVKKDDYLAVAVQRPNKTIEGVIAYIKHEAKKQAQDGCACVMIEEVYKWAKEYIMDKELDFEPKRKAGDPDTHNRNENFKSDERNKSVKPAKKRAAACQAESETRNTACEDPAAKVKTLAEQLEEFYSESELFRGL